LVQFVFKTTPGRVGRIFLVPLLGMALAAMIAAPWLDERLVWVEWLAVAIGLTRAHRLRGWAGEAGVLVVAIASLAMAFHWTPAVLAYAMNTEYHFGLLFAVPIVIWDAIRLAAPFWLASRTRFDLVSVWLPSGLLAVVLESVTPTVFPWKLGYSQIAWLPLVQSVDLFGPEFSTFVLFAHAGVLVWLGTLLGRAMTWKPQAAAPGSVPSGALLAIVMCAANAIYGLMSIASWDRQCAEAPAVAMKLVQANPEDEDGIDALRGLTADSCAARSDSCDIVCWPESSGGCYHVDLDSLADPDRVERNSRGPTGGMRPLVKTPCPLLFGAKFFDGHPERPLFVHQSALLIDDDERVLGRYHKRHLMPFGEYVPGGDLLPDIRHYFAMQEELTEGTEATVIPAGNGVRLGVMLCYEDMLSSAARSLVQGSANVLVSLINGSAFTEPLTLRQHRLLAQLRAVECRRAFVRCAATGETCLISPTGAIANRLPLGTREVLDVKVPLLEHSTIACRTAPAFPIIAAAALAWISLSQRRRVSTTSGVNPE